MRKEDRTTIRLKVLFPWAGVDREIEPPDPRLLSEFTRRAGERERAELGPIPLQKNVNYTLQQPEENAQWRKRGRFRHPIHRHPPLRNYNSMPRSLQHPAGRVSRLQLLELRRVVQRRAEVPLPAVRKHRHNGLALEPRVLGQLQRSHHGGAAADPREDALLGGQSAGQRQRVVLVHLHNLINEAEVQHLRNEARPDALDLVRAWLQRLSGPGLADHGALLGLHGDDVDGLAGLPELRHAGDGSARADATHEDVCITTGRLPDLRSRRQLMDPGIGRVLELHRHEVLSGVRRHNLLGLRDRPLHPLRSLRQHQVRPEGLHDLPALNGHTLWDGQDALVTPSRGDEGQGDAGVARSWLHDSDPGPQKSTLLGVPHEGSAKSALHGVGRVPALHLHQHPRTGVEARRDLAQGHQRGLPNGQGVVLGPLVQLRELHVGFQPRCWQGTRKGIASRSAPDVTRAEGRFRSGKFRNRRRGSGKRG
eukprot:RCo016111